MLNDLANSPYKFQKVVIIGAGGVGFWLTVALCRDLTEVPIEVWDNDTFEGGNGFRRLPHVINKATFKVDHLVNFIEWVMEDEAPGVMRIRLTKEIAESPALADHFVNALVVDCTDMAYEPRKELWQSLKKAGATVMRVSYDGNGTICVSPSIPFTTQSGEGGYALVPSMGQSFWAGGLGASAVMHTLLTGKVVEKNDKLKGGN